ncbi:ABC transporter ATP-binding protein [Paractinoplanes durhamensis]
MGRAIVRQVNAFLFDEPLSNLDAKLRGQMRTEISRMQRRLGTTTVYVTHDQTEAMTLGDRVAVLRRGYLQQVASPRELYEQPVNMFVAGFIGSPPMNFMPAVVTGDRLKLPFLEVGLPSSAAGQVSDGQLLIAGMRPDHFEDARLLDPVKRERGAIFRARVDVTEWLGDSQYAYLPFESNPEVAKQLADLAAELDSEALRTQLIISIDAMSRLRENHEGEFWADTDRMHLFDPKTGINLTRDEAAAADLASLEQEELADRRGELAK